MEDKMTIPTQSGARTRQKIDPRVKETFAQVAIYLVLILGLFVMLYPVLFAVLGSLSSNNFDIERGGWIPIPSNPFAAFANNYGVIVQLTDVQRALLVTVFRIVYGFVVTVFTSMLLGFIFSKLRFPGKRICFMILLSSMMIPGIALTVPDYIWQRHFPLFGGNNIFGQGGTGLLDNPARLLIGGWLSVYNIFLIRQALKGCPDELNESAQIDGARFLHIVFRIYMPLVKPVLAVMFLNSFIGVWGDYLGNLIYFRTKTQWHTIANVFANLMAVYSDENRQGGPDYPTTFALCMFTMVPPIIVYALIQGKFVEGLSMGAVKG